MTENWWNFTVDPVVRTDPSAARLRGESDINPQGKVSYADYLMLSTLLASQRPSSVVPDERFFIVGHQLFELVFKLAIFDLAVVTRTCAEIAKMPPGERTRLAANNGEDAFWGPATTAAARVEYSFERIAPLLIQFFDSQERFNHAEFYSFRPNLGSASGFQSANFRLIQKALGKTNLLKVPIFPGDAYQEGVGLVPVDDVVVLREQIAVATPSEEAPEHQALAFDETLHVLLGALHEAGWSADAPPVEPITAERCEEATRELEKSLAISRRELVGEALREREALHQRIVSKFQLDLASAASAENQRRSGLANASAAVAYAVMNHPDSAMMDLLRRVIRADRALHLEPRTNFLEAHLHLAKTSIEGLVAEARRRGSVPPPSGTGGGGPKYLEFAAKKLYPLFPAAVAARSIPGVLHK